MQSACSSRRFIPAKSIPAPHYPKTAGDHHGPAISPAAGSGFGLRSRPFEFGGARLDDDSIPLPLGSVGELNLKSSGNAVVLLWPRGAASGRGPRGHVLAVIRTLRGGPGEWRGVGTMWQWERMRSFQRKEARPVLNFAILGLPAQCGARKRARARGQRYWKALELFHWCVGP